MVFVIFMVIGSFVFNELMNQSRVLRLIYRIHNKLLARTIETDDILLNSKDDVDEIGKEDLIMEKLQIEDHQKLILLFCMTISLWIFTMIISSLPMMKRNFYFIKKKKKKKKN